MKQVKTRAELHNEVMALQAELDLIKYRHVLAREGRKFWRREAKRLGTPYDYHATALREEGRYHEVYAD